MFYENGIAVMGIAGNASKDGIVVDVYADDNMPFFCTAAQQQEADTRFMPRAMLCARQLKDDIKGQGGVCFERCRREF